jgi:hypothetical protein
MEVHLRRQLAVVPKYAVDVPNSIFATQNMMKNKKLTCINTPITID